jgi:xanthine dehydrogenase YagS FAD-binding subunit
MLDFDYVKARDVSDAVSRIARDPAAKFIAGGTNLIDLMKENVARPTRLIDITGLPLTEIEETDAGGLLIGALVPNRDLAYDARITTRYPLLSSAIVAGASPSSAIWPRPAATFCSGRAASISDNDHPVQ